MASVDREIHADLPLPLLPVTEAKQRGASNLLVGLVKARLTSQHADHGHMHSEMVYIFFFTLIAGHIGLTIWKKKHFRSYQLVSLIGLLLVPIKICVKHGWFRFVTIWFAFCLISTLIMLKGLRRPITATTPRLVYKYFYALHLISGFLSIMGYCLLFYGIFCFIEHGWMQLFIQRTKFMNGFLMLFYGFYYGVVGRDFADVITDKMTVHIGYHSSDGIPSKRLDSKTCALCNNPLLVQEGTSGVLENSFRVNCGHQFHEFCLRGWRIVGKKDTCPCCKEKLDDKSLYQNPWDRPNILFGQYLDVLRYLVAWLPLMLYSDRVIFTVLGLE